MLTEMTLMATREEKQKTEKIMVKPLLNSLIFKLVGLRKVLC